MILSGEQQQAQPLSQDNSIDEQFFDCEPGTPTLNCAATRQFSRSTTPGALVAKSSAAIFPVQKAPAQLEECKQPRTKLRSFTDRLPPSAKGAESADSKLVVELEKARQQLQKHKQQDEETKVTIIKQAQKVHDLVEALAEARQQLQQQKEDHAGEVQKQEKDHAGEVQVQKFEKVRKLFEQQQQHAEKIKVIIIY